MRIFPFAEDVQCPRRALLARVARLSLGVTFADSLGVTPVAAASTDRRPPAVITLFMRGAMSHLDTFDPKPDRAEQGETGVIRTKLPGVVFGAGLERLAALADRLTVMRAVGTQTADHQQGVYLMRTGYESSNSIRHPSFGSWALEAREYRGALPGFVFMGDPNSHPGCGFLDPRLSPVSVADPSAGIPNAIRPRHLPEPALARRLAIAGVIDKGFHERHQDPQVDAYDRMYDEAVRLVGCTELEAFDINREPSAVRERYGGSRFGKACLLARRLTEAAVPVIEIDHGNWDLHTDMYLPPNLPALVRDLDRGMGTLIGDLEERGLLSSTLVVLVTEFGRTPAINANGGRDHHPAVFSCVLAGAGVKRGMIHGASDERGHSPDSGFASVADFNTTVAAAAGLPHDREFVAPNGRPFRIGGGGTPVREVLA